jgi:hypothetical protein
MGTMTTPGAIWSEMRAAATPAGKTSGPVTGQIIAVASDLALGECRRVRGKD